MRRRHRPAPQICLFADSVDMDAIAGILRAGQSQQTEPASRPASPLCPGGGIGRRAGFRCQWPLGRGSSSLLLGTTHLMYITDISAFYVLTGQVTHRMTYNQSPHIRVRSGIYHFVRRVPAALQQHYRSDRVSISLRTKSARAASRSAVSISQRLDDHA